MKNVKVIIGAFWGDEGKGKCSHYEAKGAKIVVRATGGANAGHTIVVDNKKYAMHLLPSSIIRQDVKSVMGPGMVIDLEVLSEELKAIEASGIKPNLYISDRATIVLPTDKLMDSYVEHIRRNKVGTTKRGIGPAYATKDHRIAIRMGDLKDIDDDVLDKIHCNAIFAKLHKKTSFLTIIEKILSFIFPSRLSKSEKKIIRYLQKYGFYAKKYICDTQRIINEALENGDNIVIEGAQAMYLDKDHGDYPFVTSSNPTAAGACCGAGIGPMYVKDVYGVMKAYCSRVGEGPFQTELFDEIGDSIREFGHEYGTTTGRPRRCGWLDLVRAKNAIKVNSISYWCVNHIDTIGIIGKLYGKIKVCIGYEYNGKQISYIPADSENCKPIYKSFVGGWDTTGCKTYKDLPQNAKNYIEFIEEYTQVPVKYIGIGPSDKDVIIKGLNKI